MSGLLNVGTMRLSNVIPTTCWESEYVGNLGCQAFRDFCVESCDSVLANQLNQNFIYFPQDEGNYNFELVIVESEENFLVEFVNFWEKQMQYSLMIYCEQADQVLELENMD